MLKILWHVIHQGWLDGLYFGRVKKSFKCRSNLEGYLYSYLFILHLQWKGLRTLVDSVSCLWPWHCAAARQTVSSQQFFQTGLYDQRESVYQWRVSSAGSPSPPQSLCSARRCSEIHCNLKLWIQSKAFDEISTLYESVLVAAELCNSKQTTHPGQRVDRVQCSFWIDLIDFDPTHLFMTNQPLFFFLLSLIPPIRCQWLFSSNRRRFQRPVKCADAGCFIAVSSEWAAVVSHVTHGLIDRCLKGALETHSANWSLAAKAAAHPGNSHRNVGHKKYQKGDKLALQQDKIFFQEGCNYQEMINKDPFPWFFLGQI